MIYMAKNLLYFDAATKTGWAVYTSASNTGGSFVESGVQEFKVGRGESTAVKLLHFRKWVGVMLDKYKPNIVGYEQAHHRGGHATETLVGFTNIIQMESQARGIIYTSVHSATLKKHITGHGRAEKKDVIEAVKKKYPGIDIIDDNHADALAGLDYMISEFT